MTIVGFQVVPMVLTASLTISAEERGKGSILEVSVLMTHSPKTHFSISKERYKKKNFKEV